MLKYCSQTQTYSLLYQKEYIPLKCDIKNRSYWNLHRSVKIEDVVSIGNGLVLSIKDPYTIKYISVGINALLYFS